MKKCYLSCFALVLVCLVSNAFGQAELTIAQVQGNKNVSPSVGKRVRVSGIVTARVRTGFFLQTPDSDIDADPATSEAIYVFTGSRDEPPREAVAGNLISVSGIVEEFRRDNEPFVLTLTEIVFENGRDTVVVRSTGNELPKPIVLKIADFASNSFDQLERFEGMRVTTAEVASVSPTGGRTDNVTGRIFSDGAFYAVLKGIARPHREPGIDVRELMLSPEIADIQKQAPKMPLFDSNPEVIRIDTDEQMLRQPKSIPFDVTASVEVRNVTGVMHYAFGRFTILTDPNIRPDVRSAIKPQRLPQPNGRQFSVAGMNLENFFDDVDDPEFKEPVTPTKVFETKMTKISLGIREYMRSPDLIAVVEAENLAGLKRLAEKINVDAVAAGETDPEYEAYLVDGNDGRGIDNGFLVKTSRVKVLEIKQFGKDEKYEHPKTGGSIYLNDRPPLMIRVAIDDAKTGKPFELTAIANHMKSYLGYSDPRQSENVRLKKRLQAEFLAKLVQTRQKSNPDERLILLGDFNSYHFSDGILDMIGTIKGTPAVAGTVLWASTDLVDPDLINLVDIIDAGQRYSYIFDGNAQTLDHMIITQPLKDHIKGFGFARINADYPKIFGNDSKRVERFSDHDPAVAFFSFDKPGVKSN